MASGGMDGAFKIWELNGTCAFNIVEAAPVTALRFFPDETGARGYVSIIVGLASGSIVFHDLADNCSVMMQLDSRSNSHSAAVTSIVARPAGEGFITAGADARVIFWKLTL